MRGTTTIVVRTAMAGAVALAPAAFLIAPAAADPSQDVLRDLTIEADVGADGSIQVTETLEWDFGSREGLGFFRDIEQWMAWEHDEDMMRVYEISDYEVSSPSGAPAEVWVEGDEQYLQLAIGAPDGSSDTRTGVQTYELSYTIDGLVNPIRDQADVPDQDELYWNVTGHEWEVPIDQVTVTVTGPAPVEDVRCWDGGFGSTSECAAAEASGNLAEFATSNVPPGEGLTIAVAYPEGSVPGAEIMLAPDETASAGAEETSASELSATQRATAAVTDPLVRLWPVLVVLGIGGIVADLVRRRLTGRDRHYVGVPPGTFPPAHQAESFPVAPLTREPTETVAFTPPQGLSPAEVGFLMDKRFTPQHLSATVVDLAVRGFLRIAETKHNRRGEPTDWALQRASNSWERREELQQHEQQLMGALFSTGWEVQLKTLSKSFAQQSLAFANLVRRKVMSQGLFAHIPADQPDMQPRSRMLLPVLVIVVLGVTVMSDGAGILAPSGVELAVLLILLTIVWSVLRSVTTTWAKPRSAAGRALYEQARGFRLYVKTAEAEQIRFEEGIDVFSRYLPYAMIYGEAERWSGIFEQLQTQGRYQANTGWYMGSYSGTHHPGLSQLGRSLAGFNTAASTSLTSTPGGSGGSGFGGGGFSGGGGGGGGGGGR